MRPWQVLLHRTTLNWSVPRLVPTERCTQSLEEQGCALSDLWYTGVAGLHFGDAKIAGMLRGILTFLVRG